jgi:hypothetical protein
VLPTSSNARDPRHGPQLLPSAFAATCVACLVCLCSQGVPGGPLNGISVATCRKIQGNSLNDLRLVFACGMECSDRGVNNGNILPYHRKSMRAIALVGVDAKWRDTLLGGAPINRVGVCLGRCLC